MNELNENDFPPLEQQPFLTEDEQTIKRLRAELDAAHARIAELQSLLDGVLA